MFNEEETKTKFNKFAFGKHSSKKVRNTLFGLSVCCVRNGLKYGKDKKFWQEAKAALELIAKDEDNKIADYNLEKIKDLSELTRPLRKAGKMNLK